MSDDQIPKIVVGVLVRKGASILLGKRKVGDGAGEYAGPGGALRFGETLEECALRKVLEETGLEITNIRILTFLNALHWKGSHYLDIEAVADWVSGEPILKQPDAIESWNWYDINTPPSPLIIGDEKGLEALISGKMYFGTVQ